MMMIMMMMMMFAWGLTALSAQPRSPHGALPLHGQYYVTVPSVLQPVCSSLLFVRRVWGHFYRQKGRRNIRYDGNIYRSRVQRLFGPKSIATVKRERISERVQRPVSKL